MFRIRPLPRDLFAPLFALDDAELAARGGVRRVADANPGFPCRVSLADAEPGEEVILVHFEHQPAATPFRAGHAIYVRPGADEAAPGVGEVPEALRGRPLSLRAFDDGGWLLDAEVAEGAAMEAAVARLLSDPKVACLHAHFAGPGCYAARIDRA